MYPMAQMFAPQGSERRERHVNSAAGRCVIRHTSTRERNDGLSRFDYHYITLLQGSKSGFEVRTVLCR